MELEELKSIWKEENKNLDDKVKLNERLLLEMKLERTTGEFDKLVSQAVLGRNLALVYCFISIALTLPILKEIVYSLPALAGGLAMLGSFISHLAINKPNYATSLVQLQKTICQFRIHMAKNTKYDLIIVAGWLLSVAPAALKQLYHISLYSNPQALAIFSLVAFVLLTILLALSRKTYRENDCKLKNAEAQLAELIAFENRPN